MDQKTLYIRTEANSVTAMGHMARCMTIADGVKATGNKAVFIVAESESARFPKERGHEVICLDRKWDDFEGEISVMQMLIKERNIKNILIDSYFVTERYMSVLNELVNIIYIDDLYERVWPVACVINYASYAFDFPYSTDYKDTKLLLGPDYFPLREEFTEKVKRTVPDKARRVLVVTGGNDEYHFMKNMLGHILDSRRFDDIKFRFVCGTFNKDLEWLKEKTESIENIDALETLPSLKDEMEEADIIISAGGTTLYEAASVGLPIICFSFVDNQLFNVKSFDKGGYAYYAGDLRESFDFAKLLNCLEKLIQDRSKREEMSAKLLELVDGNGAQRIAKEVLR